MRRKVHNNNARRGTVVVFTAVSLTVLIGFTALAIDVGYMYAVQADLQEAADAAALAGAQLLPDDVAAVTEAIDYADYNLPGYGMVLDPSDVEIGNWDTVAKVFAVAGTPVNAVRVQTRRAEVNGNPLSMFFAGVLGVTQADVSATATARASSAYPGTGSRVLIDDEMIDSDVPVIERLANYIGMDKEDIISDLDGDWFIDL